MQNIMAVCTQHITLGNFCKHFMSSYLICNSSSNAKQFSGWISMMILQSTGVSKATYLTLSESFLLQDPEPSFCSRLALSSLTSGTIPSIIFFRQKCATQFTLRLIPSTMTRLITTIKFCKFFDRLCFFTQRTILCCFHGVT